MKIANVLLATGLATMAGSSVAENPLKKSDLPAAVQKTADEQSDGARVIGYTKDTKRRHVEYEVQLMVGDRTKDVTIDPEGNVVEVEEEVALDTLSANVFHGLCAQARKGKLVKVESLTKHSELVAYEAQVITGAKQSEIQVGADGHKLVHKE
jgi:hypothetical protein